MLDAISIEPPARLHKFAIITFLRLHCLGFSCCSCAHGSNAARTFLMAVSACLCIYRSAITADRSYFTLADSVFKLIISSPRFLFSARQAPYRSASYP